MVEQAPYTRRVAGSIPVPPTDTDERTACSIRPVLYNLAMTKVSTAVARKQFSDMVNRASYAKERVVLTRYGKTLAAIVPAEDLEWLEAMEDRIDSEDAEKALAEMKAKGEKPIPLAKLKKKLGL